MNCILIRCVAFLLILSQCFCEIDVEHIAEKGKLGSICFKGLSLNKFVYLFSTNIVTITTLQSNVEFIASSYSEDGELYFICNNTSIQAKIDNITSSNGIMKQFHDVLHSINCSSNKVCELTTSPYGMSCITVKADADINYSVIIKRYVKLVNIIQFIIASIIVVKAKNIVKYKQVIIIPFILLSGIFIGYSISLNNKINRNDTIGIIFNNIIDIKNNILPYFDFTDYVSMICFIVLAVVIGLLLSVDYIYLWIIRYLGLFLMFNSVSSLFYGMILTSLMLLFVQMREYFK